MSYVLVVGRGMVMRYLLVILEDETTVEPDADLFEFDEETRPDPHNVAECLDRVLDACDPEKLGARAVYEIPPDHYTETPGREGSKQIVVGFNFSLKGALS